MPRPRQQASPSQLSPGQASYVLDRLIADRRISPGEVNRYVSEMGREISELEQRLQRLREAHGGMGGMTAGAAPARRGPGRPPGRPAGRRPGRPPRAAAGAGEAGAAAAPAKRGRRRRGSAITAEQLASRQLQGRYLALVRRFPQGRRATFAKVAKERGREAAIREMQDSLKK